MKILVAMLKDMIPLSSAILAWLVCRTLATRARWRTRRKGREALASYCVTAGARYFARGDDAGAAEESERALVLDQDCALAWLLRGLVRSQRGDFTRAIADYDRALALRPGYALTFHRRGVAKHYLGDIDGAIADYDRAIGLDPVAAGGRPRSRPTMRPESSR